MLANVSKRLCMSQEAGRHRRLKLPSTRQTFQASHSETPSCVASWAEGTDLRSQFQRRCREGQPLSGVLPHLPRPDPALLKTLLLHLADTPWQVEALLASVHSWHGGH